MAHITTKKVELTKLIRTTTVFLIHYLRMMVTILTSIQKIHKKFNATQHSQRLLYPTKKQYFIKKLKECSLLFVFLGENVP